MSNHYCIDFKYLRSCVNWKLTLKAINISRCFTSLEDLAELALRAPSGLGSGEMSCMAIAFQIRSAFMTDEKKARKFASEKLALVVETTPKLYGWLHYNMHLSDGDHMDVISEHERHESMPLTRFFSEAFETAMHYRVMKKLCINVLSSNTSDK